jgi:SulP family sulfate permease
MSRTRSTSAIPVLQWVKFVTADTVKKDLYAGSLVGIFVLAEGIAYAMIAGLPVQYGLYTAIVPVMVAAMFGSSRHLVSGPTTPISLLVFGLISPLAAVGSDHYIHLTLTLTLMVGLCQLLLGLARLGTLTNFVSQAVLVGFTTGAALAIACSQLKHVFGITIPHGESFLHSLHDLAANLDRTNLYALTISLFTLTSCIVLKVRYPRLPGILLSITGGTLVSLLIGAEAHGVELVGKVPEHLPPLSLPGVSFSEFRTLAPSSVALAIIALVQASSISRSIATKSHQKIDGNQEFIGQGLSNIVGSLFSCYPSTGSFTRSALNYEAGGSTPLAPIISSVLLGGILLWVAPLASHLPIPAISGAILFVAYRLIDFKAIRTIIRTSLSESSIMVATAFCAIFFNLEFAIYLGVVMSLGFYLMRMAQPHVIVMVHQPDDPERPWREVSDLYEISGQRNIHAIRVIGSMFFGAVTNISDRIEEIIRADTKVRDFLLLCDGVDFIDVAGSQMLVDMVQRVRAEGRGLYLVGMRPNLKAVLDRGGFTEIIGEQCFLPTREAAHNMLTKISPAEG